LKAYICAVKKIVFLLTLFIVLKPILPVLEYVVNYEYITKVLCINKSKPKLQCNGKCHLMKELAKTSENQTPISSDKKIANQELEVWFFEEIKSYKIASFCFDDNQKTNSNYSNLYFYLNSVLVFHPPRFIS
jgi:hypothetical protein